MSKMPSNIARNDVVMLYRAILLREPAEGEVDFYVDYAANNNITRIQDLSIFFLRSHEFLNGNHLKREEIWDELRTIEYDGLKLSLPHGDFTESDLRYTNSYEPYVTQHMFANLRSVKNFVDVGANLGLFALPVAKRLAPGGHVYAFEASAQNANLLYANAKANKISNISIFPIAVGDRNGSVFSQIHAHSSNRTVFLNERAVDNIEILPVIRLDSFWDQKTKIDMIKVDIEGFEYRFFVGAANTVSSCKPKIYMEYADSFQRSGSGVSGETLLDHVLDYGYKVTILHRSRPPELVVGSKTETIDAVNGALQRHITDDRGTHLDLYFEIAG